MPRRSQQPRQRDAAPPRWAVDPSTAHRNGRPAAPSVQALADDTVVLDITAHSIRHPDLPRHVLVACRRIPRHTTLVIAQVHNPELLTVDLALALALARRLLAGRGQLMLLRTGGPAPTAAARSILELLDARTAVPPQDLADRSTA